MSIFLTKLAVRANETRTCTACSLRSEASTPVPWDGPRDAKLMIVGRNPGRQEDKEGIPFYPHAPGGRMLMTALAAAGLERRNFIITNLVKCYTTNDRPPEDNPIDVCYNRHLIKEVLLFKPDMMLLLGNDAFRKVVNVTDSVTQCRQTWFAVNFEDAHELYSCYAMGTWHPGSAVRQTRAREEMIADIRWLAGHLTQSPPTS